MVSGNENFTVTIILSFIFLMLGWSSNFVIAFKIGSSAVESKLFIVEYPSISNCSTALLKKSFINSATFLLLEIISSFSTSIMFLEHRVFSEKRGLTVFQNFLLSVISLGSKF